MFILSYKKKKILSLLVLKLGLHSSKQEQEVKLDFHETSHALFKLFHCFKHSELITWETVVLKYIFTQ